MTESWLRSAPADLDCFTFLPAESARHFWARRQAHETAIHRVDAENAAGGSGLGLAIARELAEKWGGTLTVDGAEGGGTAITASFPEARS